MNSVVPACQTASIAGVRTTSRIPHLRFHILRKKAWLADRSNCNNSLKSRQHNRNQSTLVGDLTQLRDSDDNARQDWNVLGALEEQSQLSSTARETEPRAATRQHLKDPISRILQDGDLDGLLFAVATTALGERFVRTASTDEFDRVFCALDPAVLIDPFKRQQWFTRAANYDYGKLPMNKSLLSRIQDFAEKIQSIISTRLEAGYSLTLPVCRHLLVCAGSCGHVRTAERIMTDLMPQLGVPADISCYNSYLQALNWNLVYGEDARFSLRITEWSTSMRKKLKPDPRFRGYTVAGTASTLRKAIRASALNAFQKIAINGLVANESTFTNLMIAMAREGDMTGVESVLKSVWNIDMYMLRSFDEEEIESPTFYPEDHHLRPSGELLFAVVHCYCINSRVNDAWMLLDFLARNFNLSVPSHIWSHLFMWTFVMSVPRSKSSDRYGARIGQLRLDEFDKLFATYTDEPYNVQPDSVTLNYAARILVHRRDSKKALEKLRQAKAMLEEDMRSLTKMMDRTEQLLQQQMEGSNDNKVFSVRRDFIGKYLDVHSQMDVLRRSVHQLVCRDEPAGRSQQVRWSTTEVPTILEEFVQNVSDSVQYSIPTGQVTLWTKPHRQAALWEAWPNFIQRATTLWAALDVDDMDTLSSNWTHLPERLRQVEVQCQLSHCQSMPRSHAPRNCPGHKIPMYSFAHSQSGARLLHDDLPALKRWVKKHNSLRHSDFALKEADKEISKFRQPAKRKWLPGHMDRLAEASLREKSG